MEGEGPITYNFVSRVIGGEARRGKRKERIRCLSRESRRCTGRSLTPREINSIFGLAWSSLVRVSRSRVSILVT